MPEPVKVNVVSYGGVKPGQVVVGNWADGSKLTLFDAATATDGSYMFYNSTGLPSWTVDLPNLTNGTSMFYGCSGLTSWAVDLPNLTNGTSMFCGCSGLTSWTVDLPNLTNGTSMFSRTNIKTAEIDAPRLTIGASMFDAAQGPYSCEKVTITGAKIGNARRMFIYQSNLSELDMSFSYLSDGFDTFWGCRLPETLVYKILTEIPTVTNSPRLTLGLRNNFKDSARIAELLNTSTPIGAGPFTYKGWNIVLQ